MGEQDAKAVVSLLSSAQAGDDGALAELLADYTPMLASLTRKYARAEEDSQDLFQEASIAFCRAVERFDPTVGGELFTGFARTCVENRLISCFRKRRKEAKVILVDREETGNGEDADLSAHILEEETYLDLCQRICALLTGYENRIWSLFIAGNTAAEIAALLGKDKKSIENAIYRVRKKLRDALPKRS